MDHTLNYAVDDEALLRQDCYTDRNTIRNIECQEGEVIQIDTVNVGIHYGGPDPILLPCNLPEAYQQTGLKIVFSGFVKEIKLNELVPGQPFVLTHVERAI